MTYNWDSSLETGNDVIDNQHKDMISAINKITEAHRQGKGREEIVKTMDFLSDYAVMHFSAEEKLMQNTKYPEFSTHKRYHEEFKKTVQNLTRKMVDDVTVDDYINTVIFTLGDWLFSHIKGDDFRMAAFVKSTANSNSG